MLIEREANPKICWRLSILKIGIAPFFSKKKIIKKPTNVTRLCGNKEDSFKWHLLDDIFVAIIIKR